MALIVTITPSRQVTNTDPVTASDLNTMAAPTAAVSGTLDLATQSAFGATAYGKITLAAGATPVTVFTGVTAKTIRVLDINIIKLAALTAGSAVRIVVRTKAATPSVLAYATLSAVNAAVVTPQSDITYTVGGMGDNATSGDGIEIVIADASNAPINGTSGTIVVAVTAIYETA